MVLYGLYLNVDCEKVIGKLKESDLGCQNGGGTILSEDNGIHSRLNDLSDFFYSSCEAYISEHVKYSLTIFFEA